jgi:membrane protein DedA with SNARE-associated domain
MAEEVVYYVTRYGYYAIFVMVFLQETGLPNPFPNELLLLFTGYLSFKGILVFPLVILTVTLADFTGTNILYFLFYHTGEYIMQKKPRWIPVSRGMIDNLSCKISKGGKLSMFLLRLTPFTRGYTSLIAGFLKIRPKVFLPVALASGIGWATIYITAGYLIGPSWDIFIQYVSNYKVFRLLPIALIIIVVVFIAFKKKNEKRVLKESN